MNKILYDLLLKLEQCDDFHNRCDYLMEHDEITYLLEYIEQLKQKVKLADHYKHLYSEVKKQKDDVVKNTKEKIKRYESYIHDLKNDNYPSPTVKQERQELIFRIREQEDLLRILGEIE